MEIKQKMKKKTVNNVVYPTLIMEKSIRQDLCSFLLSSFCLSLKVKAIEATVVVIGAGCLLMSSKKMISVYAHLHTMCVLMEVCVCNYACLFLTAVLMQKVACQQPQKVATPLPPTEASM